MIPNFCLGSQPSEIPLILHGLPFGFQPIEARYIFFHNFYFFLTHTLPFFNFFNYLLFLFFLSLSFFSSPLFFFCRYGYKRGFGCFILLLCPLAPTFLGILGTAGFEMSWALKHTCSFCAALRRPTFSGSWNGGIS